MRTNITVHVPQNEEISYSLYARGFLTEKPEISADGKEAELKFLGGTAVVLFYYFQGIFEAVHSGLIDLISFNIHLCFLPLL